MFVTVVETGQWVPFRDTGTEHKAGRPLGLNLNRMIHPSRKTTPRPLLSEISKASQTFCFHLVKVAAYVKKDDQLLL